MLTIGMIGTSGIAHEFAKALLMSGQFAVKAVYSRTLFKAEGFGKAYGAELFFDDLEEFMEEPEFAAVYIASPNSLHFEQTLLALENGKHVIVEKPAFSNSREWEAAFALAEEKGLFLMEAARHLHDPNFQLVRSEIAKLAGVDGADLHYGKYSSRYDQVLAGEEPNIFSPAFSGGALMDLGVYALYAALAWFGIPESGQYFMKPIQTGVDGAGTVVLRYPYFHVSLHISKIYNDFQNTEIYCGKQTLTLDSLSTTSSVELYDGEIEETVQLAVPASEHAMLDEANAFARLLQNPTDPEQLAQYQEWKELSRQVALWMEKLRKDAGIHFAADQKND